MKHAQALTVSTVIPQGSDAALLCFALNDAQRSPYAFTPGQYLTLEGGPDDNRQWRCYSITSDPAEAWISVLVRRVAGGLVSNWLCDHVRPGATLRVFPPAGHFTLRQPGQPLLLFAGGSGIAPIFSLARQALNEGAPTVTLFYANRNAGTAMLMDELADLTARFGDRLQLRLWYDEIDGLPQTSDIAGLMPPAYAGDVYLCGPDAFMQLVQRSLTDAGCAAERILCEEFVLADDASNAADGDGDSAENAAVTTLQVTLKGEVHHIPVRARETLLAAMMSAKLPVPHACKVGECASCMCRLESGDIERLSNSVLDEDDEASGWLLACRTHALSASVSVRFP